MELGLASAMLVCTSKMHSKCKRATSAVHVPSMPNDGRQHGVGCFIAISTQIAVFVAWLRRHVCVLLHIILLCAG